MPRLYKKGHHLASAHQFSWQYRFSTQMGEFIELDPVQTNSVLGAKLNYCMCAYRTVDYVRPLSDIPDKSSLMPPTALAI